MKIKYIKNAPNAAKGDIKDLPEAQAKILIHVGAAEEYKAPSRKKKTETEDSE